MSRIAERLARAGADGRAALITYLCAGDPAPALTPDLLVASAEAGADILEVGMPFSDPTADGPTIQAASRRALDAGTTMAATLKAIAETRSRTDTPIVLFGYYNPILRYGEAKLAREAKDAGVDGLLVVDLPPESAAPLLGPLSESGLDFIPLIAPTSPPSRVKLAAEVAGGFLYYVSMTGVTGSGGADLQRAAERAAELRAATGHPVAVGFGIKHPDDVRTVAQHADGVVVGSALVRAVHEAPSDADRIQVVRERVGALAGATRRET